MTMAPGEEANDSGEDTAQLGPLLSRNHDIALI